MLQNTCHINHQNQNILQQSLYTSNTALTKYRSVAHFMLPRRWVTEAVFEAEGSFKSALDSRQYQIFIYL